MIDTTTIYDGLKIGRCQDCRWWRVEDDDEAPMGWGSCDLAISSSGKPENTETLAFALDGEWYGASFRTAPIFGCVQFEAKSA